MDKLESAFKQLIDRDLTSDELGRLYSVKDTLALADDDAIWTIILALEYHLTLFDDATFNIVNELHKCFKETKIKHETELKKTTDELKEEIFLDIKSQIETALLNASTSRKLSPWAFVFSFLIVIIMSGISCALGAYFF